jgi:hypothetical protein
LDPTAFRNAALAPGKIGAAVSNAGDFFQDVSEKIQANRNARTVFNADLAMRKTKDAFTANLANMPDEGTWIPAWKQQVDQTKEQVLNGPNMGPEVKRSLGMKFDQWEQATTGEITTAALLKGHQEARKDTIADATYAAHQGHVDEPGGAHDIMRAAVENHIFSPQEAGRIGKNFDSIAAQSKADTAISSNPIKAPELIQQFKDKMDPRVYVGVMAKANEAKNRAQADNGNDLAEQMDNSPDGTIDPKLLAAKVKNGDITQRFADGLNARMQRTKDKATRDAAAEAKQDFNVGMMELQNHHWTDDTKPEETARDMKDNYSHLPTALRTRLYKAIDGQIDSAKKQGKKEERPVETLTYQQMKEDRDENGLTVPMQAETTEASGGFLGMGSHPESTAFTHVAGGLQAVRKMDDDQIKEKFGPDATRESVLADEQKHYANQMAKMRDFFESNPKATQEEADKYRQHIERPYVSAAVSAELKKHVPVSITTEDEFNKLPSGARFIFNGRVGTVP